MEVLNLVDFNDVGGWVFERRRGDLERTESAWWVLGCEV